MTPDTPLEITAPPASRPQPRPRPTPRAIVDQVSKAGKQVDVARLNPSNLTGVSGLARIVAGSAWRAVGAVTKGSVGSATGLLREIGSGEPIGDIIDTRVEAVRSTAWRALGLDDHGPQGPTSPDRSVKADRNGRTGSSYRDLRAQGDALLRLSADPTAQPRNEHPAFTRILEELAPDEARILRFMSLAGPQPAIDVRTKTPLGVGSERIAGGINLIAEMAGCAYPERNQQYLANLNRLGMIRFSEEQVEDPRRYSFIEAQPTAAAAMAQAKKTKTIYRSIYISLFGKQFCEVCFTMGDYDAGGWIRDIR